MQTIKTNFTNNAKECTKCGKLKLLEEFSSQKRGFLGKTSICKECGKIRYNLIKTKPDKRVKEKQCKKCDEIKSVEYIVKSLSNKDGYANLCKKCRNKRAREIAIKKKESRPRKKYDRYTTKTFKNKLNKLLGNEYELIGEYIESDVKTPILHKRCGKISEKRIGEVFLDSCKYCSNRLKSSLSSKIENAIREVGAFYKTEVSFEDCKNERPLSFDFGIYRDKKLIMLIEADGAQHFVQGGFRNNILKVIQKRDEIKNEYCLKNSIPLLRINYLEENQARSIIIENVEKDKYVKRPKKYFTKSIVDEELAQSIREYFYEYGGSTMNVAKEFNIGFEIVLKVLRYKYHPDICLDLKDKIDYNLFRSRHPSRLAHELSTEELEEIRQLRSNGATIKDIGKQFGLVFHFYKQIDWWYDIDPKSSN